MSAAAPPARLGPRGTMILTCLCFLALGVAISAIGPALPELAARADSSLESLGGVFSALFLGALVAQLAAGPLSDRLDQRLVLLGGITQCARRDRAGGGARADTQSTGSIGAIKAAHCTCWMW
jgi:MFS family permease